MNSKPWILIVQDAPELFEEAKSSFEEMGYRVMGCSRHNEALRLLLNQKFACILVDYQLQDSTAEQMITSIKRNPQHMNFASAVVLFADKLDGEMIKRLGKNLSAALIKPYALDVLKSKVADICPPANKQVA